VGNGTAVRVVIEDEKPAVRDGHRSFVTAAGHRSRRGGVERGEMLAAVDYTLPWGHRDIRSRPTQTDGGIKARTEYASHQRGRRATSHHGEVGSPHAASPGARGLGLPAQDR